MAQRHLAKINKYRGEYDKWGNRLTRSYLNVRHLLEYEDSRPARGKKQRRRKQRSFESVDNEFNNYNYDDEDPYGEDFLRVDNIQFGIKYFIRKLILQNIY